MSSIPEMSVLELADLLQQGHTLRLIDVREEEEWNFCRIPSAELIPLSQWPAAALEKLTDKTCSIVVQCHHGGRSARAAAWLLGQGFSNVKNLAGGIDAWSLQVEPSVPRYE